MSVDRTSAIPLHAQIRQLLTDEIASGTLRPGGELPGEPDLSARFGVSRMTVRQALGELAAQGLIVRQQGRVTRVADPPLELALGPGRFYAFASEMTRRGLVHRSQVLEIGLGKPPAAAQSALGIGANDEVARIVLLRLHGDEPLMIETAILAAEFLPLLRDPAVIERSLYDLLETRGGIAVTRATESIRPIALARPIARHLAIRERAPAFAVVRTSFAVRDGREYALEWRESFVRGDRYRFVAELHREQLGDPRT
jgi:GntR family transcriptional regulator